jgi:uncharacterized UPF0160 family protein
MTVFPCIESEVIRIATHCCPHHVDELVGVALLAACAAGSRVEVAFLDRASIAAGLDGYDAVVDIGLIHDPATGRFDHHQETPDVAGRSAAGLVFDALFADDPRRAYLAPVIAAVDRLDAGNSQPLGTGEKSLTLSAVLKAVGGFEPDTARSLACLKLMTALVNRWLEQATDAVRAAELAVDGERVGAGLFLPTAEGYGPPLRMYLRDARFAFVGFPQGGRFQVATLSDDVRLPAGLPGATFVHPKGFLAAFPDRSLAVAAMLAWSAA